MAVMVILGVLLAVAAVFAGALIHAVFEAQQLLIALCVLLMMTVMYGLSLMLPAAAIGRPIGIWQALKITGTRLPPLLLLTIISVGAGWLISSPAEILAHLPGGGIISAAWSFVSNWIVTMVSLSMITTIYGVYVENRKLA